MVYYIVNKDTPLAIPVSMYKNTPDSLMWQKLTENTG
jgi:hypothetical protein